MTKPIKPGTDNKPAGTYHEVGPRGGKIPGGRTVHIDKGDRLPPTQKPGRAGQNRHHIASVSSRGYYNVIFFLEKQKEIPKKSNCKPCLCVFLSLFFIFCNIVV